MVRVLKVRTLTSFIPENHYKSIIVTINGKNVSIPKSAYDDLYEIGIWDTNNFAYYDKEDDVLYIIAHNGDGYLAYEVCWQIVKGEYKTRIIGETFQSHRICQSANFLIC